MVTPRKQFLRLSFLWVTRPVVRSTVRYFVECPSTWTCHIFLMISLGLWVWGGRPNKGSGIFSTAFQKHSLSARLITTNVHLYHQLIMMIPKGRQGEECWPTVCCLSYFPSHTDLSPLTFSVSSILLSKTHSQSSNCQRFCHLQPAPALWGCDLCSHTGLPP